MVQDILTTTTTATYQKDTKKKKMRRLTHIWTRLHEWEIRSYICPMELSNKK